MDIINRIIAYFSNYDTSNLATDIVLYLALFFTLSFVLVYSAKHHSAWYAGLIVLSVVLMGALTILGAITDSTVLWIYWALIILTTVALFPNELRRTLYKMSIPKSDADDDKSMLTPDKAKEIISAIVKSCQNLSKNDTGALIVICDTTPSDYLLESGTYMNAEVSSELIETLFYPKCPLHDGAILIKKNKIMAAGCYLPLSQRPNLPKDLGTRHRAALGITESDPTITAIVVSEETGIISVMHDGNYKRYLDAEGLIMALENAYSLESSKEFWV